MKKKCRNIGIGFITGRKSFRQVLTTYLKSWGESLLMAGESVELSLFVAYDLEYTNTQRRDYTNINIELQEMLKSIHFIDRAAVQAQALFLCQNHILTENEAALFFEKGYAGKRNAILYEAAKKGMEAILFLDDDEYPLAVQKTEGKESWTGQQILSAHLQYIDRADLTCGYHCGYISTIPNLTFNKILTEEDFHRFIEAISNDVLNWDSMKALLKDGSVSYAQASVLSGGAVESPQQGNAKFITGSNLCLNLQNLRRLSPFYNPPLARGEDTFLSTCLEDNTVLRVPCYTFHDGFSLYTAMLKGVLPQKLRPVSSASKKAMGRFYAACIGWIRYKPLLLYITNRETYPETIAAMRSSFQETLPKLCAFFNAPQFMKIAEELDAYDALVETHYNAFLATKAVWQKLAEYLQPEGSRRPNAPPQPTIL